MGGLTIFLRSWKPAKPRGVVAICHGVNSHGGQYIDAGEQFTAKLYEGHFHDLLHAIGKEQVIADITAWIEKTQLS